MDLNLTHKIILVTAASRGLGKAIARQFAREGARVSICARTKEIYQTAVEIQSETGQEVLATQVDLNRPADIETVIQKTVEKWVGLDILVTNCGRPPTGTFSNLNREHWESAVNLILFSAIHLIQTALPYLRQSKTPAILTLTSVSAKQPIPNLILSNSLRAGLLGLTKTLSQELGSEGIRVNSILPGWIGTERQQQLTQMMAEKSGKSPEEVVADIAASIALQRIGIPEEFANVAVFLCSPAASFVTGVMVPVDGGLSKGLL